MSIRSVQTSFTSSLPSLEPSYWSSTSSVLNNISMNHSRTSYQQQQDRKYPPGLGISLPSATGSSPMLVPSSSSERTNLNRRRSGSFSYYSGNTFSSGNVDHRNGQPLANPPIMAAPQPFTPPRRRPGLSRLPYVASSPYRSSSPPFSTKHAATDFSSPIIKFDPFANDDTPTANPSYNHYWQYNPSTNSPMVVYKSNLSTPASPPPSSSPSTQSQLAQQKPSSNVPYTIKLPPSSPTPIPLPKSAPKPDRNARSRLVAGILLNRIYAVGKPMRRRFSELNGKAYVPSSLSTVISVEC